MSTTKMWAACRGKFIVGAFPSKAQTEKNILSAKETLTCVAGTFVESRTGGLFAVSLHGKLFAAYADRRRAKMYVEVFSGCEDRKIVRGNFREDK